jgi:uncharacterized metal-binding protein
MSVASVLAGLAIELAKAGLEAARKRTVKVKAGVLRIVDRRKRGR